MYTKSNTIFWAIVCCLLWSTAYAGIKIGLQYDSPFHFAGIRFIVSGLLILPFTVKPSAYLIMIRENWKIVAVVTFLQTLINYAFFYKGLQITPGALGAVVVGSQPLVTALVSAFFKINDKLTGKKIVTIIFGISGVILISAGRQAFKFGTAIELLGVLMLLIASIATALSNVVISYKGKNINPLVLSSSSLFIGGLILYLVSFPIEGINNNPKPAEYWYVLAYLSVMAAVAFSVWYKLLQRPGVKVSDLNLWKFLIPVVGAILSWWLVPDENPEWVTISGMVIITVSLVVFFRSRNNFPSVIES